jgi:hypothetical protein
VLLRRQRATITWRLLYKHRSLGPQPRNALSPRRPVSQAKLADWALPGGKTSQPFILTSPDWQSGSRGRAPSWQVQGPEFKPHITKKKKKWNWDFKMKAPPISSQTSRDQIFRILFFLLLKENNFIQQHQGETQYQTVYTFSSTRSSFKNYFMTVC